MGMMRMKMVTLVRIGRSVISTTKNSEDRRACRLHRTEPCTVRAYRIVEVILFLGDTSFVSSPFDFVESELGEEKLLDLESGFPLSILSWTLRMYTSLELRIAPLSAWLVSMGIRRCLIRLDADL